MKLLNTLFEISIYSAVLFAAVTGFKLAFKGKKLDKYFPKDFTPAQKEERIIKALDLYCRRLERMKSEHEHER